MMQKVLSHLLLLIGPCLFGIFLFIPTQLNSLQQAMGAIMLWVIAWWLNPKLPLPITGLVGVSLTVLLGVATFPHALKGYANPVIFLFMGGFFIAQAMRVHQLDLWIAQRCLSTKWVGGSPLRVFIVISILATFFSMIISNTATTAMFIPIVIGVLNKLDADSGPETYKLLLMVAYATTIGGIGTPLGSPPNVIGISLLESMAKVNITFLEWFLKMIPLMMLALGGLFLIFWKELKLLPKGQQYMPPPINLNRDQIKLSFIVCVTIFLWIFPGLIQLFLGQNHPLALKIQQHLPEGMVAIAMSSILFFIPSKTKDKLLIWDDAKKIDWGVLLLFGSGISLGQMMFDTGLTHILGAQLPFGEIPYVLALLLLIFVTLFATELVSNTATANLLIPLIISTPPFNEAPLVPVLGVCLASSMAFMLPVGTPPSAIVFGSGKIKLSWMFQKGLRLNLICLSLIWVFSLFYF